jgi:hypothetical protein
MTSNRSLARFTRLALGAGLIAMASVALRGERAQACGGGESWGITELTTFDPKVLGDPINDGLYYDPFVAGYQGTCESCGNPVLADWAAYLKDTGVVSADWEKVLYTAPPADLTAIGLRLAGKAKAGPAGYEQSSLWAKPAGKAKLGPAVAFVQLAREVEGFTSFEAYDQDGNTRTVTPPPDDVLVTARAGMKSADKFLAQRYAFQVLRILFYRRDWRGAVGFFDKNQAVLAGPSQDRAWNARLYVAGALARDDKKARANLELARIHAGYPPLSAAAALDFRPAEEVDWRASLKLAKTAREQAELWRLVGIKSDGIVAMQEIIKLDPKSNLIGLLLVRELARAESRGENQWGPPEPTELAAQQKSYALLAQIATDELAHGGDRPWLLELVIGHIAAKRGDIAGARAHLARATAARPGDALVASQAKASLAMAIVANWKIAPAYEQELARTMAAIDPGYGRLETVRLNIRSKLAEAYVKAGDLVDAEFLKPGIIDPTDPSTGAPVNKTSRWSDPAFIRAMLARTDKTATEFDKFVVSGGFDKPSLQRELALRLVLDGDFAGAARALAQTSVGATALGTDPFVIHIIDCHECDQAKYANASWTAASLVKKLAELEKVAKGNGEAAAVAALSLGSAMYNVTHHGNTRILMDDTHQATSDASAALRWYKRAYELTKNRELQAKAAYYASKAELGNLIHAAEADPNGNPGMARPTTWFAVVKQYGDTKYYKQVLKECGYFADYARAH